ncbi:MAG: hypothetical protein Q7J45_00365 [bacterium]|nr:hypothetical protein [bacterium]
MKKVLKSARGILSLITLVIIGLTLLASAVASHSIQQRTLSHP